MHEQIGREFIYVTEGRFGLMIDGKEVTLEYGDLCFLIFPISTATAASVMNFAKQLW